MKLNIISFESISSTNLYLKENYQSLKSNTVCIASRQTLGRGRFGRTWQDNIGSALFSILLKDNLESAVFFPFVAAYATVKVLSKYVQGLQVKWPNDILINSKKLCGILVEGISTDKIEAIVIGIGINVNNKKFNSDIMNFATSLSLETNKDYDINSIIIEISTLIIETLNNLDKSSIIEYLENISYLKNKEVTFTYQGQDLQGVVEKINENGSLKIRVDDQIIDVFSGEVTLTNIYKH